MYPLFCALAEALAGIKEPWWESIKAGERLYFMETGEHEQEKRRAIASFWRLSGAIGWGGAWVRRLRQAIEAGKAETALG